MVVTLICGVSLAYGHHRFFSSLAGHQVQSDNNAITISNMSVSQQRFNTAIGTTFAFLVKSSLTVAVTTAYVQLFWKSIGKTTQHTKISTVNTLSSATSNPLDLVFVSTWTQYPVLFTLATLPWLIPLAAIVTPATLTTRVGPYLEQQEHHIPKINFYSTHFYNIWPDDGSDPGRVGPAGPQDALRRIVSASAIQAEILSIDSPAVNATWRTRFFAPSLRCGPVNSTTWDQIMRNVQEQWHSNDTCAVSYGFMSWSPRPVVNLLGPFSDASLLLTKSSLSNTSMFYAATFPNILSQDDYIGCQVTRYGSSPQDLENHMLPNVLENASILSCELFNSTYELEFLYNNGRQTINLVSPPELHNGSLINGAEEWGFYVYNKTEHDWSQSPLDTDSISLMVQAYRAVMETFAGLLNGIVASRPRGQNMPTTDRTLVMQTRLANTAEFAPILQAAHTRVAGWLDNSAMNSSQTDPELHLDRALEELFQNVTISLMSSPYFLQSKTCLSYTDEGDCVGSKDYNTTAMVTVETWPQVYEYFAKILLIAYGTVILVSTIAVLIGLWTIFTMESSYSNDFSTILRATRHAQLSATVDVLDDGRDPLPSSLADASVSICPLRDDTSAKLTLIEHGNLSMTETTRRKSGSWELQDLSKAVSKASTTRAVTM